MGQLHLPGCRNIFAGNALLFYHAAGRKEKLISINN
jgi:hypothetical protein